MSERHQLELLELVAATGGSVVVPTSDPDDIQALLTAADRNLPVLAV